MFDKNKLLPLKEEIVYLVRKHYENPWLIFPSSIPEQISSRLKNIKSVTNPVDFCLQVVMLERELMEIANDALTKLTSFMDPEKTLFNQKNHPLFKKVLNFDDLIYKINSAIAIQLEFDFLTQNKTFLSELFFLNAKNAFLNIVTILNHTDLDKEDNLHIIYKKCIAWILIKTLFYPTYDNRFFKLFENLSSIFNEHENKLNISLKIKIMSNNLVLWETMPKTDEDEIDIGCASDLNSIPMLEDENEIIYQTKNKIISGSERFSVINPKFYSGILNAKRNFPGAGTSLVHFIKEYKNESLLKSMFSGLILFSREKTINYYPSNLVLAHELIHVTNLSRGESRLFIQSTNTDEDYWMIEETSRGDKEEFYTTFGHPQYSEHDLFLSMNLSSDFKGRIFYLQPLIFIYQLENKMKPINELMQMATIDFHQALQEMRTVGDNIHPHL